MILDVEEGGMVVLLGVVALVGTATLVVALVVSLVAPAELMVKGTWGHIGSREHGVTMGQGNMGSQLRSREHGVKLDLMDNTIDSYYRKTPHMMWI